MGLASLPNVFLDGVSSLAGLYPALEGNAMNICIYGCGAVGFAEGWGFDATLGRMNARMAGKASLKNGNGRITVASIATDGQRKKPAPSPGGADGADL